jgi:hypothetical protein
VYGKRWDVFPKTAHVITEAVLDMEHYTALINLIGMRKIVFKLRLAEDRADVTEEAGKEPHGECAATEAEEEDVVAHTVVVDEESVGMLQSLFRSEAGDAAENIESAGADSLQIKLARFLAEFEEAVDVGFFLQVLVARATVAGAIDKERKTLPHRDHCTTAESVGSQKLSRHRLSPWHGPAASSTENLSIDVRRVCRSTVGVSLRDLSIARKSQCADLILRKRGHHDFAAPHSHRAFRSRSPRRLINEPAIPSSPTFVVYATLRFLKHIEGARESRNCYRNKDYEF